MSFKYVYNDRPFFNRLRASINEAYLSDETVSVNRLIDAASLPEKITQDIAQTATTLIEKLRHEKKSGLDSFLATYDLSSQEGVALMCLAEAMLRIPDPATQRELIHDKIGSANWQAHVGASSSTFVNAATWALVLTGKIVHRSATGPTDWVEHVTHASARLGETVIRKAIKQAMGILSQQFVLGETIQKALKRAKPLIKKGYRYSFDMLGEAARTAEDAKMYIAAYHEAINIVGKANRETDPRKSHGVSVKLSALHPRYEFSQRERVLPHVILEVIKLCEAAKKYHIGITLDAEEATRLDLMIDVVEALLKTPSLDGWAGLGLAVQAYQKRAFFLIDYIASLAQTNNRSLMVRLVKGAYWDTEIKAAQVAGLENYPVFTRKVSTDVSFVACAKKLFTYSDHIYPQFATHNAYTVATILQLAEGRPFEFQRLHGMGEALYQGILSQYPQTACCIYAPVGAHQQLLAYLVRRLLENGANSSFVHRLLDDKTPLEALIRDPVHVLQALSPKPHPAIVLPKDLFQDSAFNSLTSSLSDFQTPVKKINNNQILVESPLADPLCYVSYKSSITRQNSPGFNWSDRVLTAALAKSLTDIQWPHEAMPLIAGQGCKTPQSEKVIDPANMALTLGEVYLADTDTVQQALREATAHFPAWSQTTVAHRAAILEKMADLLEQERDILLALCVREAGKTLPNAMSEIREAIDFCRYYAALARKALATVYLPGPTGEENQLSLHGRGVFVCISPWNFPLAIFLGQIAAALVCGNTVIAKPAEQTPLIASFAVQLFLKAGVNPGALSLLPGIGEVVGSELVVDPRVAGVMFTGSVEVAKIINRQLAEREGPIIPLIAETGGQNAMIVDSTALPEQTVMDVIRASFDSAGQRCSALRVLFIQDDVAKPFIEMLVGAMKELILGDPGYLSTDVGPVIDNNAKMILEQHVAKMQDEATLLYRVPLPSHCSSGYFFPPTLYEISSLRQLTHEVFGPVLHIIRYPKNKLEEIITDINQTGFGLTFGVHSRLESRAVAITNKIHAGNHYINRDTVGAVVGVQPFGGEGLSGTGPKAGGPHYLYRLVHERTLSINTTALGGNASLLAVAD